MLSWLTEPANCRAELWSLPSQVVTGKAGIVWGMKRKYLVCDIQEAKEVFKYVSLQYHT